jgi:hypothetical protein
VFVALPRNGQRDKVFSAALLPGWCGDATLISTAAAERRTSQLDTGKESEAFLSLLHLTQAAVVDEGVGLQRKRSCAVMRFTFTWLIPLACSSEGRCSRRAFG